SPYAPPRTCPASINFVYNVRAVCSVCGEALVIRARLLILGIATSLIGTSSFLPSAAAAATVPSFGHVFVILGENKSLFQITSSKAPYIMNTLKPQGAWSTNYNDVAKRSLADYVGITSGQYAPCETTAPCA